MDYENSLSIHESDFSSSDEIQPCKDDMGKVQSGRKPLPIKFYVKTRKVKIAQLKKLSEDKSLSVNDRKKYRAQKFAL